MNMSEVVDTVQMRIKREPTWALLTNLKTEMQLSSRREVTYDEIIQTLLNEHRQKQEVSA
ncbi:MAG: hypothetical protein ACYCT2_04415 [Thermoplasmataceae archaeon]